MQANDFPHVFSVRQRFEESTCLDIEKTVHAELVKSNVAEKVSAGQSVAITAGSRGISNIALLLRDPHIHQYGAIVYAVYEHIVWLHVAVNDAKRMDGVECLGDFLHDLGECFEIYVATFFCKAERDLRKGLSLHQLHYEID